MPATPPPTGDLLSLLHLDRTAEDRFVADFVFEEEGFALYGGQVAAQALRAAGATVAGDRYPHSLHGYFLRAGDAARPTTFEVYNDRDGRSFSARRVVASQRDEVIFSASLSFTAPGSGPESQTTELPAVAGPESCTEWEIPRVFSLEAAIPPEDGTPLWPSRFWSRFTADLGADVLINACALTYLSDVSADIRSYEGTGYLPGASLDHAVWFHHPARMSDWVFSDYTGRAMAAGRGLYTGSVFDRDGRLIATIAQETLARRSRKRED